MGKRSGTTTNDAVRALEVEKRPWTGRSLAGRIAAVVREGSHPYRNRMEIPPTGTISHGTMRPQDLVPAFMEILKEFAPDEWRRIKAEFTAEFTINYSELVEMPEDRRWQSEFMSHVLNEDIWSAMNDLALPGYYFGSTEGDGCDYGFWRIEQADRLVEDPMILAEIAASRGRLNDKYEPFQPSVSWGKFPTG